MCHVSAKPDMWRSNIEGALDNPNRKLKFIAPRPDEKLARPKEVIVVEPGHSLCSLGQPLSVLRDLWLRVDTACSPGRDLPQTAYVGVERVLRLETLAGVSL